MLLGQFTGPQIAELLKSSTLDALLTPIEKNAFDGIRNVVTNFLGNKRADNYKDIVREMIHAFRDMKVSLKIHFLDSHLDFFPDNCGDCSDEHGERFHKDIATIEQRFKGKDSSHMLGEYCWSICRETETQHHKRQNQRNFFLKI